MQLGVGCPGAQVLAHGAAYGGDVGERLVAQMVLHGGPHRLGQIGVVAVEVLGCVQLKAPHWFVVHPLGEPDRVGHGHQNHFARHLAGCFSGMQQGAQVVGHQHAGQLFGVQAGLEVDLAPLAWRAKVQTGQRFLAAQAGREQWVVGLLHIRFFSVPDRLADAVR